ncbi:MAG: hypothetical protein ACTHZ9_03345 [Leucobacter sp.]
MGAGLNLAAYAHGHDLEHAAMRVYGYMALRALDTDAAPKYWGGREALAAAIGGAPDAAGFKAVQRALSALRRSGLVRDELAAHRGRQATYLLLDGAGSPLRPFSAMGDAERPPKVEKGGRSAGERVTVSVRKGDGDRHPEEEEEKEEERGLAPSRFCSLHPDGTQRPCGACARAREQLKVWEQAQAAKPRPERVHQHRAAGDGSCIGGDDCLHVLHPTTGEWVPRNDDTLPMPEPLINRRASEPVWINA